MNLFKFSILSFLVAFSLVTPNASFAADVPATTPKVSTSTTATIVATVNIVNAKITSQVGNTFNISFGLSNREGLQTGVKYGVKLIMDKTKYVSDEKVYDESITLYENSTINRDIVYTAPTLKAGTYSLVLSSQNTGGFPFGIVSLGKVKLVEAPKGVIVQNDSCYLTVEGEKGSPHYKLTQSIDISASESLRITCSALNEKSTPVSVTPIFETRYTSAYGDIAPQSGGDNTAISFKKNEKKNISFVLPKGEKPQSYSIDIKLTGADTSSNTIFTNYILSGVSASIAKLSLDKDIYYGGDKGEMSILWLVSGGNTPRSIVKSANAPVISLALSITNDQGRACINPISQALVSDPAKPDTTIPFSIKTNCTNPQVKATITDDKGSILDEKDFTFKSNPIQPVKPASKLFTMKNILIAAGVLLAIIALGFYLKKKNDPSITI
ncbi:MAG: hypothetical protein NTU81_02145 [Candidatus Nomurabacteria bacterium]|nr:hypothetical protein [Candidatus Nomurabacteria bacterium]